MLKAYRIATQPENAVEIRKQIQRLLRAADVGDRLPTPRDDVVAAAELAFLKEIDLRSFDEGSARAGLASIVQLLSSAVRKVKGLLHFKKRIIYIDPLAHPSSVPFITYHEVSHKILPGHRVLSDPHLDNDMSLDPVFARELEIEANIGATLLIFQLDRFAREIRDSPFGLASAAEFAQKYAASFHSTFRHYTETTEKECALLVLSPPTDASEQFSLWYAISSCSFKERFGMIDWPKYYAKDDPVFGAAVDDLDSEIKEGEMVLSDTRGFRIQCQTESFHNSFNCFVLLYPKPRYRRRQKIIVLEKSVS